NNNQLMQARAQLDLAHLADILRPDGRYPRACHDFIVEIMRKFDLCHDFLDRNRKRLLLVPQLLFATGPDLRGLGWKTDEALNLQYHYDFLPGRVFDQFIAKMYRCLTAIPTVWRKGV